MISRVFLPLDKSYQKKTIFIRKKQKGAILTKNMKNLTASKLFVIYGRVCHNESCV
ncbi:hypothetical protein KM915_00915 [Cytobacillus oceanisediminis]|uniref:hypothetical protein n=1 Tax=Cytobacillus TaxID=2675230 RepID=UPI0002F261D9|nr:MULTISPECIES: hypothetical protein [Cytobacillus]MBU8728614.1 hypothetical protein [Cytobacillus oceanisediminis]MCM3244130.1 hypothetical protein [Cytobacillus oceanisediminis]MCM3392522.1 hypothetical protein [Cytobacillus oceanisediminis]